uniref:Tryptophan aminotransferase 1 n=1 Tax=Catharanthus roseus TaxID=4058 RepID=A0A0U1XIN8_CATRO|nr:tryptophan aminotransferase 1 [Catharanthus roseus]
MCGTDTATGGLVIKNSTLPPPCNHNHPVSESTENGTRSVVNNLSSEIPLNLDHGDPRMFESYWKKVGDRCKFTIEGHESLSYFANPKNLCWFLEPKLEEEIKKLHKMVGNVKVEEEDQFIIVGNGSSQLIQAAFYALSPLDDSNPINVVSAAPYYSCYPEMAGLLKSGLYKWGGDAHSFNDKEEPFIEMVTSPNNPSGVIREPVVNGGGAKGKVIYDLAYYWPQYTPITAKLDHDLMLFTVSKCTGHAGSRIGWAIVKDKEVAKRMIKFMEISTIGVAKESQLRAAKLLGVISDSCSNVWSPNLESFFEYGHLVLKERWEKLREVVKKNPLLSLQKYPLQYCHFFGDFSESHPAFAWMNCKNGSKDLEKILRGNKILVRGGRQFGTDPNYVRISMVCKEEEFNLFLQRLSAIKEISD